MGQPSEPQREEGMYEKMRPEGEGCSGQREQQAQRTPTPPTHTHTPTATPHTFQTPCRSPGQQGGRESTEESVGGVSAFTQSEMRSHGTQ